MTQTNGVPSRDIPRSVVRLYAILIGAVFLVSGTVFFSWYEGKDQSDRQGEILRESLELLRHLSAGAIHLGDYRIDLDPADLSLARTHLDRAAAILVRIDRHLPASVHSHCPAQALPLTRELDDLTRALEKMEVRGSSSPGRLVNLESQLKQLLMNQGEMQACLSTAMREENHTRFRLHLALLASIILLLFLLLTLFHRFERRLSATVQDLAREKEESARRADEILRRSSDLRALVEASQDAIFIETLDGRILDCNRRACELHGYTRDEMLALHVLDLVPRELAEVLVDTTTGSMGHDGNVFAGMALRKDGSIFPTEVSIVPSPLPQDERVFVYLRDVSQRAQFETERTLIEARLRQQQKLEGIGTLASGVAHEINNPVNIIINYADLILSRLDKPEVVEEFAREIRQESERIAVIVKDLLAFSRQEKESHSPAQVEDIVTHTLSIIRKVLEKDQIELSLDIAADLPPIKCRSQQIQQVLMNLLTNARDALNDKYSGSDPNKQVIIRALLHPEKEEWIRITVEDHGPGIPLRLQERIFDPFFTTKPRDQGTGLGLSVSHGLVKEHKGSLTVESEPGQWSRFHIDLRINNGWTLKDGTT